MPKNTPPAKDTALTIDTERAQLLRIDIAGIVQQDLAAAAIGTFFGLRAGIGLLRIRDLCGHGSWEARMLDLCPGKSARMLRRYMQIGKSFLDDNSFDADAVWTRMTAITSPDNLLADPDAKDKAARAERKADKIGAAVREYVQDAGSMRKALEDSNRDGKEEKPLTRAQRIEAASGIWSKYVGGIIDEGIQRRTYTLLPDDELDSLASNLRTVADALRKELASRSHSSGASSI
jgi:hypothetical protein